MRTLSLLALFALACAPTPPRDARVVDQRTPELGPVVDGNNALSLDLYQEVAGEPGNLFFSPFSITSALSMTWAGAADTTSDEMATVLHATGDETTWHQQLGALTRDLSGDHEGRGYTLNVANKLFGQTGYPWKQPFLDVTATDYGAPLQELDYTADPEAARHTINQWVADQTMDRIPELLPQGSVEDTTRIVLANAIYFKADWALQFDPADTSDQTFHLADGGTVTVPMMSREGGGRVAHLADPALTVLQLPYQDDEVSMVVLLPDAIDGLPDVESALTPEALDGWIGQVSDADDAYISLPKFELHQKLPLAPILADLGMPTAFDPNAADFTGMADVPTEPLYIQDVLHEAWVKVDEQGTEAAAATGVVVGTTSAMEPVVCDHPFVFLIRDDLTGTILFLGRVEDPS